MRLLLLAFLLSFGWLNLAAQSPNAPFRIKVSTQNPQCDGAEDGAINVTVIGGVTPAIFQIYNSDLGVSWGGFIFDFNKKYAIADIPAGKYRLTVSDTLGRDSTLMLELSQPPELLFDLEVDGERCAGTNKGAIKVTQLEGGTPPYATFLNNGVKGTTMEWKNMYPGQYFVTAQDANGCRKTLGAVLPRGTEFDFELDIDEVELLSGDSMHVDLGDIPETAQISWIPSTGVISYNAYDNLLFPSASTNYTIQLTDTNGCVAQDRFSVIIHRSRDFFVPNVFSPDAQFIENRLFTIFTNGGIRKISAFRIWDRHGDLWFESLNHEANDPSAGWDGTDSGGKKAPSGVYFWVTDVEYTDGRKETFRGDVTLIR